MLFETRQQFLFTERRDAFRLAERVHFVDNVLPYSYPIATFTLNCPVKDTWAMVRVASND